MAPPPINKSRMNLPIVVVFAGAMVLSIFGRSTSAQDLSIRVETNQVRVPATVFDKERYRLVWDNPTNPLWQAYKEGNNRVENLVDSVVIHGLTAHDFQVLDDGKEQEIQNVVYEQSPAWVFHDNKGDHAEFLGEWGGKWSSPEWPPRTVPVPGYGNYVLTYALPESPEGSCHQIRIKVNRRNAFVLARREYCNIKHSPSDPLIGTTLGKQLESNLATPRSKVDITFLAADFFTDTEAARVHVVLDWPWESLKLDSTTYGVLGMVFKKDGSLATRFSDLLEYPSPEELRELNGAYVYHDSADIATRYETQLILPPGEYDVRIALSDGTKFGRAETPLTVQSHDRNELAISKITLCKQIQDASPYSASSGAQSPGNWTTKIPGSYVSLVSKDIEFKPTADTRFKKRETLYTFFQIYEPLPEATVQIQMRIVNVRTREVQSDSQPISAAPYIKVGSPIIPVGRGMDIRKLPKGSYRLDVQATDSTGKSTPWRTANFTIE